MLCFSYSFIWEHTISVLNLSSYEQLTYWISRIGVCHTQMGLLGNMSYLYTHTYRSSCEDFSYAFNVYIQNLDLLGWSVLLMPLYNGIKYCFKNLAKVFRSNLNILSFILSVLWRSIIHSAVHETLSSLKNLGSCLAKKEKPRFDRSNIQVWWDSPVTCI